LIPQSSLPDYVDRGGEQVWRPPASARDVELYGFVIPADRAAIDSLLQRDLVLPSGGAVDYRCAHDSVIVTFGSIGRECSLDPVDAQRGFVAEREVSVWCLVADMHAGGRLLWYIPYIFTNSEVTVATGREIFGYPKQLGYFEDDYPKRLGPAGGLTTVEALAINPFDPLQPAIRREMISVDRQEGAGTTRGRSSILDELELLFGDLTVDASLPGGQRAASCGVIVPPGARPPASKPRVAPWIRGILNAAQGKTLTSNPTDLIADMVKDTTLVFLKQFRDISCATKACYQAVVEAPLSITLEGASLEILDPSLFEVKVCSWASNPIADELGIPPDKPLPPERAFLAKFGFDILLGLEVWRAPT
jgi:hypothetical protein